MKMAAFGRLRKEETKHNPNLRQGHVHRALSVNNTQLAQVRLRDYSLDFVL